MSPVDNDEDGAANSPVSPADANLATRKKFTKMAKANILFGIYGLMLLPIKLILISNLIIITDIKKEKRHPFERPTQQVLHAGAPHPHLAQHVSDVTIACIATGYCSPTARAKRNGRKKRA